jgi:hypothetical protein
MFRDCFERASPSITGFAIRRRESVAIAKPILAEREREP